VSSARQSRQLRPGPIDVHAHAVIEESFGTAGDLGPRLVELDGGAQEYRIGGYTLCGVRYRGSVFMDPVLRVERMDQHGIAVQVLSPNPLTYFHHIEPRHALEYCRRHNDALARIVADRPDRLLGLAQVPIQDPDLAGAELERAVRELGLLGPYIGSDPGPRTLDDAALDAFWATCVRLDVPAFVHPAPSGIDGPLRDPRLRRFDLDLILEFAYEESLAVAQLVFGGVLHRHPALDVCLSHGGGAVPYLFGRWNSATRLRAWSPDWLREPGAYEAQLRRLWFDVHVADPRAVRLLAEVVGEERLVMGTNFGGWDTGGDASEVAGREGLLADNARRLLRV
jgi:aminocarboxymuconate-semialdehyde decarboxylase